MKDNKIGTLFSDKQMNIYRLEKIIQTQCVENAQKVIYNMAIMKSQDPDVEDTAVEENQLDLLFLPVVEEEIPKDFKTRLQEQIAFVQEYDFSDLKKFNSEYRKLEQSGKFLIDHYCLNIIGNDEFKKDYPDLNSQVHPRTKEILLRFYMHFLLSVTTNAMKKKEKKD